MECHTAAVRLICLLLLVFASSAAFQAPSVLAFRFAFRGHKASRKPSLQVPERHQARSFVWVSMGRFDMEKPHLPSEPAYTPCPASFRPTIQQLSSDARDGGELDSRLRLVLGAMENAVREISGLVRRHNVERVRSPMDALEFLPSNRQSYVGEKTKPLDVQCNEIVRRSLFGCGEVAAIASEEDDEIQKGREDAPYVVVHDPLDGSSNIDAAIPVGTIFGVYSGTHLVAAGYAVYGASTQLVLSWGTGSHGFTLDSERGCFVLTHKRLAMPTSGASYSVNEGRYFDWPEGLRKWVETVRLGEGRGRRQYGSRYVCSLVSDVHYVMLHGGIAMNPRSHLRLVYEGNPIAFLVEQAGGAAVDGKIRILEREPASLHERLPLFVGSVEDVDELMSFGDVQQVGNFTYHAVA